MRQPKVGDTVKITSDISKLQRMQAGFVEDMYRWAGRLAVAGEYSETWGNMIHLHPTSTDIALGIFEESYVTWLFDIDLLEVVEEATDATT